MLQTKISNKLIAIVILIVSLYSFNFLFINTKLSLVSYNFTNYLTNLDITSVSDFEDSFALLSDSLIFLEQDGVFVFDYYSGVLYSKKDLKWENSEESREVFFLKPGLELQDYEVAHKRGV